MDGEAAAERPRASSPGHEIVFQGSAERPPAEAIDLVRGIVRGARVERVARLQTLRRRVCIAAGDEVRPVAEVVDDEVSVLDGRRVVDRFREIEVELAEGAEPADVTPVLAAIAAGGHGRPCPSRRSPGRSGLRPPPLPTSWCRELARRPSARDVIARAIADSVVRLIGHDAAVRLGDDPEGVHQARVATRRLRSHLRTYPAMLDREWCDGLREELGWLGDELGAVRDLDVLEERFRRHGSELPGDDAGGCREGARPGARADARRRRGDLLSAMREHRYVALLDALVEAAANPRVLAEVADAPGRRRARRRDGRPVEAPAQHAAGAWVRIRATPPCTTPGSGPSACATPLSRSRLSSASRPVGSPRRAEALQEVLGAHQDAVVATAWLRHEAMHAPARLAFAAGRLAAMEASVRDEARADWPEAWKRLRRTTPRFWR